MWTHGTRIRATGGPHRIGGRLIGDHDRLDGSVYVLTDHDEALILNGWMFVFEVVALPPPRPETPRREQSRQRQSPASPPERPRRRATPRPWSRPWYLRENE